MGEDTQYYKRKQSSKSFKNSFVNPYLQKIQLPEQKFKFKLYQNVFYFPA